MVRVIGHDGERWVVEYPREDNRGRERMLLEATTEADAQFEAASLLGVEESKILIEYD